MKKYIAPTELFMMVLSCCYQYVALSGLCSTMHQTFFHTLYALCAFFVAVVTKNAADKIRDEKTTDTMLFMRKRYPDFFIAPLVQGRAPYAQRKKEVSPPPPGNGMHLTTKKNLKERFIFFSLI